MSLHPRTSSDDVIRAFREDAYVTVPGRRVGQRQDGRYRFRLLNGAEIAVTHSELHRCTRLATVPRWLLDEEDV